MFQCLHGLILYFTVFSLMGIITVDLCPLLPVFCKPSYSLFSFLTRANLKCSYYGKEMTFHRINCGKIFSLWRNNCPHWLHLSRFCHSKCLLNNLGISSMLRAKNTLFICGSWIDLFSAYVCNVFSTEFWGREQP